MAKPTNEARIKELEDRVDALEAKSREAAPVVETPEAAVPASSEITQFPIPQEYRDTVSRVFNQAFGVQLVPMSDSPAFQFNIVVPEKYSSLNAEQRKIMGADIRSKVISYAEGVNGVKVWCDLVLSSFNPEVRAQILADKA